MRRERLFRDRRNPLHTLTDEEIIRRYRFTRHGITQLLERVGRQIQHATQVNTCDNLDNRLNLYVIFTVANLILGLELNKSAAERGTVRM